MSGCGGCGPCRSGNPGGCITFHFGDVINTTGDVTTGGPDDGHVALGPGDTYPADATGPVTVVLDDGTTVEVDPGGTLPADMISTVYVDPDEPGVGIVTTPPGDECCSRVEGLDVDMNVTEDEAAICMYRIVSTVNGVDTATTEAFPKYGSRVYTEDWQLFINGNNYSGTLGPRTWSPATVPANTETSILTFSIPGATNPDPHDYVHVTRNWNMTGVSLWRDQTPLGGTAGEVRLYLDGAGAPNWCIRRPWDDLVQGGSVVSQADFQTLPNVQRDHISGSGVQCYGPIAPGATAPAMPARLDIVFSAANSGNGTVDNPGSDLDAQVAVPTTFHIKGTDKLHTSDERI